MLVEEHLVKVEHEKDIKFSIIIPAHNEEKYLGKCLDSIEAASKLYKEQLEIIVVLKRCSDKTEETAKSRNCITVQNNDKNLSKILSEAMTDVQQRMQRGQNAIKQMKKYDPEKQYEQWASLLSSLINRDR